MECGVTVGLSLGNEGSVGLSGWEQGIHGTAGVGGGVSLEELECKEGFRGSVGREEEASVWKLGCPWGC